MRVLAFLQNMWVLPHQVRFVSRWDPTSIQRERMITYALFAGCITGRRLRAAFGEFLCDSIRWQEASPVIANSPRDYYPPDRDHILAVLHKHQPGLVLGLTQRGWPIIKDICSTWNTSRDKALILLACPHPAARHPSAFAELQETGNQIHQLVGMDAGAMCKKDEP